MEKGGVSLTPEQQAVVAHDRGPALVYAVAGAGKTTSMVHRIERLVREGVFAPERILATSFGRENARDLRRDLSPWPHCSSVDVRTLHSLGLRFIRWAQEAGHYRHLRLGPDGDGPDSEQAILYRTLRLARSRMAPFASQLDNFNHDDYSRDFLTYVGACKGDLAYADLEEADLPSGALAQASQAKAPAGLEWYLDLYRLFERVRMERGIVTFGDQLMLGWEALVRFPEVRARAQAAYDCVLVDEFQDINRAQSEILDIITARHRNYMAIGDDDQTIYEWRGASPYYILDFARRYKARTYLISENFRCPAGPLALANRAIAHNRRRRPKRLRLTQGLHGTTQVLPVSGPQAAADAVMQKVRALQRSGGSLNDMAVLVRLNAQTPYIEQRLIAEGIPYRVSQPFYERTEIRTLIAYARLAWFEHELKAGRFPFASDKRRMGFEEAWRLAHNRPTRYVKSEVRDRILERVLASGYPLSDIIVLSAEGNSRLMELAEDLSWLSGNLEADAWTTLTELEERLDYREYLRSSSGFPETGAANAASVAAFIEYSRDQGTLGEFLLHVKDLAARQKSRQAHQDGEAITLSTIHQAKGREWPIVLVPECNEGTLPFADQDIEEERRLFYVALTRCSRDLTLLHDSRKPASRFLAECDPAPALKLLDEVRQALARPPEEWKAADALALVKGASDLYLVSYFRHWWQVPGDVRQGVAQGVQRFLAAAEEYGVARHLGLKPDHALPWREMAPLDRVDPGELPPPERVIPEPPQSLPLLRQLLAERSIPAMQAILRWVEVGKLGLDEAAEVLREGGAASIQFLTGSSSPVAGRLRSRLTPTVRQGTWVRCDAGWGQVTRIEDSQGKPLDHVRADDQHCRLHVTLRPGTEPEKLILSMGNKTLTFPRAQQVYVCGTCGRFISANQTLVLRRHGVAAHGQVGSSLHTWPAGAVKWRRMPEFHTQPPRDERE